MVSVAHIIYLCHHHISFAYTLLDTAEGALVLFAAVQITMVLHSYRQGNRLALLERLGFILMFISGVSWAFYTINGQASLDPLWDNHVNFLRTLPFVIVLLLFTFKKLSFTSTGLILAILSGALASAVGYYLWLQALKTSMAAALQLSVPILAALGEASCC